MKFSGPRIHLSQARIQSDAQSAACSSVPAHVEMMVPSGRGPVGR